jgi:conjugative relaxase-like TrwC/TraI family protein
MGAASTPDMICNVTVLGGTDSASAMAGRIVNYLEGLGWSKSGASTDQVVSYYQSSVEGVGRWMGSGVAGLVYGGQVEATVLESLLAGVHPETGVELLSGVGMAGRGQTGPKDPSTQVESTGPSDEWLNRDQVAVLTGLSWSRVNKLCAAQTKFELDAKTFPVRHAQWVADQAQAVAVGAEFSTKEPKEPKEPTAFLKGQKNAAGEWEVQRGEVERFKAGHTSLETVVGYDITFSAPKSVSLTWALADASQRAVIEESMWESVRDAISYMEANGLSVAVSDGEGGKARSQTFGANAAGYMHATNRLSEPQLHVHVVVAKQVERPDGSLASVDATGLFAHAKTAGYLASAGLRERLTTGLGVAWTKPRNGVAEIVGWDRETLRQWSSRKAEIDSVAAELGLDSPAARQNIAYRTRNAKDESLEPVALRASWHNALASSGHTGDWLNRTVVGRGQRSDLGERDVTRLFRDLSGPKGLTEINATFDRRDVIQHIAQWALDRMDSAGIEELADLYLATADVTELHPSAGWNSQSKSQGIERRDGTFVADPLALPRFSTVGMQAVEHRISQHYDTGRNEGVGIVAHRTVRDAIRATGETGIQLGADQVRMVQSITTSGHGVQFVVGPAGSGKTTALAVAAAAWHHAGFTVLGASVNGNAAETLARETGIDTKTLESRLTSMDLAKDTERRVLTDKHVVIVDEASTVGTRDLERLLRHAAAAGAIVRLVGDPAQHSSVEAGGIFRALLDAYPNDSVALTQNRRQKGPEMEVVRQSLAQYRAGHVAAAWEALAVDGRVQVSGDPQTLLNRLVCDWNDDRACHVASPDTVKRSSMMAESHLVREALNDRARIVLRDAGVLRGPDASIGVHSFAVGDEVICRHATKLAPKHDRDLKVRNGTRGVVVGFSGKPAHRNMIVDFEGGRGPIVVPHNELTRELRPGVEGIITHSYALTTHAAQGETFDTGRTLASEHVSREGLYVGLSRGQHDAVAYVPDDDAMLAALGQQRGEEPFLPVAAKTQRDLVDVIGRRLQNQGPELLSAEVDPYAGEGHRAATKKNLRELDASLAEHPGDQVTVAAIRERERMLRSQAVISPLPVIRDVLGDKPDGRRGVVWERTLGKIAIYTERYGVTPDPMRPWRPHGTQPAEPGAAAAWESVTISVDALHAIQLGDTHPPASLRQLRTDTARAITTLPDPEPAVDYAEVITHAFLFAAENALFNPAIYLTDLIGPRPAVKESEWFRTATGIELYRHQHLGLDPRQGPVIASTNPVLAAIGQRPSDPVAAIAWSELVDGLAHLKEPQQPQRGRNDSETVRAR